MSLRAGFRTGRMRVAVESLLQDVRDLVEVMAGRRKSEDLDLSDRLRRQVEQILWDGSPYAGE